MKPFKGLFTSRKFWAAIAGLLIVVLRHFEPNFPVSDAEITNVVYLLIAYIVGTGLSDVRA